MRKSLKKALAAVMSAAMAIALLTGIGISSPTAQAADVTLPAFYFQQGGQYNPSEPGNEGYITSVKMHGTDETIDGWLTGEDSIEQRQYAAQPSNGFDLQIANTGWDADWANGTINPWSIAAGLQFIPVEAGHIYKLTFTARATSKKYALIDFRGSGGALGNETSSFAGDGNCLEGNDTYIELDTEDKTFEYTVTNFLSAALMDIEWMFGAFDSQVDYSGIPMMDHFPDFALENGWRGTVTVSNVTVTDAGVDPEFVEPPTAFPDDSETESGGSGSEAMTQEWQTEPSETTDSFETSQYYETEQSTETVQPTETTMPAGTTQAPGGSGTAGRPGTNGESYANGAGNNSGGGKLTVDAGSGTTISVKTPGEAEKRIKKPGRVKIRKVLNLKGEKVKVVWKKVKSATRYQVKIGARSKFTRKLTCVIKIKGINKRAYVVYVRAYNGNRCGKWSKVKVKKRKYGRRR